LFLAYRDEDKAVYVENGLDLEAVEGLARWKTACTLPANDLLPGFPAQNGDHLPTGCFLQAQPTLFTNAAALQIDSDRAQARHIRKPSAEKAGHGGFIMRYVEGALNEDNLAENIRI